MTLVLLHYFALDQLPDAEAGCKLRDLLAAILCVMVKDMMAPFGLGTGIILGYRVNLLACPGTVGHVNIVSAEYGVDGP